MRDANGGERIVGKRAEGSVLARVRRMFRNLWGWAASGSADSMASSVQ